MDTDEHTLVMKQDALGRVTVPRERREVLLDEFERSGLPECKMPGIQCTRSRTVIGLKPG